MRTLIIALLLVSAASAFCQDVQPIQLPPPQKEGGKPLLQCLNERHSTREFSPQPLPVQTLSNLLWAAFGINRDDGRRTAPSAMNRQEVDVYAVLANGVYLYDAKANALQPVLAGDHRGATGKQDFVAEAPLNLVYVADYARMGEASDSDKSLYSVVDVGFISENVYLFCASEGLATVVRGWVDREALAKTLALRADQRVILAQTVGFPEP